MTRRCSVMRMPLDAHRASMSLPLVAVATWSSVGHNRFSTIAVTSRVEERAPPRCDPVDPNNRPRDGRRRGIRHGHKACGPECCPRQLPGTLGAHRYLLVGANADQPVVAKVRVRAALARLRPKESPPRQRPCATK